MSNRSPESVKKILGTEPGSSPHGPLESLSELRKMVGKINQEAAALLGLLKSDNVVRSATPIRLENLHKAITELTDSTLLNQVRSNILEGLEKAQRELPTTIKYYCEQKGLQLSGGYPDYIIEGFLYLGIDSKNSTATLSDSKYPLFPVEPVLENIPEEISKLSAPSYDPMSFLQRLWSAHQRCQEKQQAAGELLTSRRVSIFRVLTEMAVASQAKNFGKNPVKEQFRSYSQHMFRADLFRLLASKETPSVHDHRLILEPTSVAEDGLFMFLPTLGRCAFVGHVVFVSGQ